MAETTLGELIYKEAKRFADFTDGSTVHFINYVNQLLEDRLKSKTLDEMNPKVACPCGKEIVYQLKTKETPRDY